MPPARYGVTELRGLSGLPRAAVNFPVIAAARFARARMGND